MIMRIIIIGMDNNTPEFVSKNKRYYMKKNRKMAIKGYAIL